MSVHAERSTGAGAPHRAQRPPVALARDRFVSITTFKRDGTPVSTPVWCAAEDGALLVFSEADSWKVKRIRRDPHVSVAPCSARGKPRGPAIEAEATVVEETATVEALLAQKYRWAWRAYTLLMAALRPLRRKVPPGSVTIRITPRWAQGQTALSQPAAPRAPDAQARTSQLQARRERSGMKLKELVGRGDRIGLFTLPFLLVGLFLNVAYPSLFAVGGPANALRALSIAVLVVGIAIWAWSVVLILRHVPRGELITSGPYALVKHPLYTDVALLVLPSLGFLLDTWLGALIGIVLYIGSRRFSPAEEAELGQAFGPAWDDYCERVKLPWL